MDEDEIQAAIDAELQKELERRELLDNMLDIGAEQQDGFGEIVDNGECHD